MATYQIRPYTREDHKRWDDYASGHPQADAAHCVAWMRAVKESLGHRPLYFFAVDGERLVGIAPFFFLSHAFLGKKIVSVPAANTGGILADDAEAYTLLISQILEEAQALGADYVESRFLKKHGFELPESPEPGPLPGTTPYTLVRASLEGSSEELLSHMNRGSKSRLRRADREGLEFQIENVPLHSFYALYTRSMKRLGSPPFGMHFFEKLLEHFGHQAFVSRVLREGRPVSASLLIAYGDTLYDLFAGFRPGDDATRFHLFSEMLWAKQQGLLFLDMGRSPEGSPAQAFKESLGGQSSSLHYEYYFFKNSRPPSARALRYRLASQIWRHLPLSLANRLGPGLVKHLH